MRNRHNASLFGSINNGGQASCIASIAMVAIFAAVVFISPAQQAVAEQVADMEDLTLAPNSYWDGTDTWIPGTHQPNVDILNNTFASEFATFHNLYTVDSGTWGTWPYWEGWSYSNMSDTTTPGFLNQYSAYPGTGQGGDGNYAVYYDGYLGDPNAADITFDQPIVLSGADITNTTYTYLSMRDGDQSGGFAKQFGGPSGTDPDFLLLTVEGLDAAGDPVGSLDFYLADYRFADDSLDYIIDDWTWVDFESLGTISGLRFSFDSSDRGAFGINTPLYIALDNLTPVPEPSTILLGLAGFVLLVIQWRRRK